VQVARQLATGTADTDAIRTETFRGREYTVVPVVGLVEGIIQGLNAAEPEFAPADEFAKFPMGWNGRPITMNHPRRDGSLVSANDTDMLEEYSFGFLANSMREDGRLKFEAWVDNEIVQEKGDEFSETLNRLNSGEDLVEVSTGLFCEVMDQSGLFNGQRYKKTWQNVVPDHLAFLSKGSIGACSVEAGCGAPRLNMSALRVHSGGVTTLQTSAPLNLGSPPPACCDACAHGDTCMADQSQTETPPTEPSGDTPSGEGTSEAITTTTTEENTNAEGTDRGITGGNEEGGNSGDSQGDAQQGGDQHLEAQRLPEQVTAELEANQRSAQILDRFAANAVDPNVTLSDARQVAQVALRDHLNGAFVYVMAMTTELCAYERYEEGLGFQTFALNYSVDANGGVQFTGEPVPVNLLVRIVQREVAAPSANEGASGANHEQEGNATMPGENDQSQTQTPPEGAGGDLNTNGAGADATAPRDLESSLATLHPDVAAVVREGIELRTQKRNGLIEKIVANSGGVYTAEDLNGKDIPELEKLETLSRPKTDFGGRAFPSGRTEGINTNSRADNQNAVPTAPKAFERKPVNKGGRVTDPVGDSAAA
jgi:hypothetical protein